MSDQQDDKDLIQIRFDVPELFNGWRLDHFIHAKIPRLSRSRIQRMIRAQLELGGNRWRVSQRVKTGEQYLLLRPAPEEPDVPRTFSIIENDDYLMAIDKPAGLPVHATARYHKNTLTAVLREHFLDQRVPTLAHRIDRETSGLMVLCLDQQAGIGMKRAFELRKVKKRYLAIVEGSPDDEGVIEYAIGPCETSGIRVRRAIDENGKPASTRYRVLERKGAYSLVEAFPQSGRQHQIRVHLSAIGCPIVGDKLYGPDPALMLEYLETGWSDALAERLRLPRHALHASDVYFRHPITQQDVHYHCPLSTDLREFWQNESTECLS
jgi:23S rRNA pseudouridine1911/1915/1917 synthase